MDHASARPVQLSDDYMDSGSARQLYISDDYMDSPSARYALAAMKPSPKLDAQQASHNKASVSLPQTDTHPHLLFLKTGGGATVAQPNHHLTPQQLQMLADGTGTLEGLTDTPHQPLDANPKPVTTTVQKQGHPLGGATGILDAQTESTQQLGSSLFTPRNGQAITKALHALSHAESQQASQGLFSSGFDSVSDQQTVPAVTSQVRPSAKSLQGVYLDQPHADKAGFSALKAVSAAHRSDPLVGRGQSLSWLDEPLVDGSKASNSIRKASGALEKHSDIIQMPLSHSFLSDDSVSAQKPALRSAVLLTLVLSVATKQSEVRQRWCGGCALCYHGC